MNKPDPIDLDSLKIDRSRPAPRRGRSKNPWTGRLILLALLLVVAWLFGRPLRDLADRIRLPEVEIATVLLRKSSTAPETGTSAGGYVVARTQADLSADTPGRIVEMTVSEGSRIERGAIVARIYSKELEASLARAEANLKLSQATRDRTASEIETTEAGLEILQARKRAAAASVEEARAQLAWAKSNHERIAEVFKSGVQAEQQLDLAVRDLAANQARFRSSQASLEAAQASLSQGKATLTAARAALTESIAKIAVNRAERDRTQASLEKTVIHAPFTGVVIRKSAEVGEIVSPRTSVATLVDLETLEVQAEVPETYLSSVRARGLALVYLDAWPETPYSGYVDRIWPVANRQKATVEVRVRFDKPDDKLRPEMGVRVVFLQKLSPTDTKKPPPSAAQVLIPRDAVLTEGGNSFVFVYQRGVARKSPIQTGTQQGNRIVVKTGLQGGEQIILDPPNTLADGDRVRARKGS